MLKETVLFLFYKVVEEIIIMFNLTSTVTIKVNLALSQSYSQKILDNTGFGVLTLDQSQEYAYFKHILASSNCKIGDEFILNFKNQNDQKYFFLDLMWIKLALVIIIFILIIRIISVIYRRKF